jgi:hypothetical protein
MASRVKSRESFKLYCRQLRARGCFIGSSDDAPALTETGRAFAAAAPAPSFDGEVLTSFWARDLGGACGRMFEELVKRGPKARLSREEFRGMPAGRALTEATFDLYFRQLRSSGVMNDFGDIFGPRSIFFGKRRSARVATRKGNRPSEGAESPRR